MPESVPDKVAVMTSNLDKFATIPHNTIVLPTPPTAKAFSVEKDQELVQELASMPTITSVTQEESNRNHQVMFLPRLLQHKRLLMSHHHHLPLLKLKDLLMEIQGLV